MYMPTEISQKNIFSKLAAKLTIPVGGLCSNKFQIKKKMFYLNTNNTEILQKHSHNSKSPQRISSKLSTMNQMNQEFLKKLGLSQVYIGMKLLFTYLDCGIVAGLGEEGRTIVDILNVHSDNSCTTQGRQPRISDLHHHLIIVNLDNRDHMTVHMFLKY